MKIIFGVSIFVSAIVASVWGFASASGMVEEFVSSLLGRSVLILIGASYILNGFWRLFHPKK